MREIRDHIDIDAPPERVWAIITDFDSFPQWNPFVKQISGRPEEGSKLDVRIAPPGKRGMRFKPTVVTADRNRELAWLGHVGIPGVFDGEHHFEIQDLGGGRARFIQREVFKGVLVGLMGGTLDQTLEGFRHMNQALKQRAESTS